METCDGRRVVDHGRICREVRHIDKDCESLAKHDVLASAEKVVQERAFANDKPSGMDQREEGL